MRRDRGQAIVPVVATVSLACALCLGVARVGDRLVDARRAQSAADAAALAVLHGGQDAAHRLASAHGARVVSVELVGGTATVTVSVDGVSATARASQEP